MSVGQNIIKARQPAGFESIAERITTLIRVEKVAEPSKIVTTPKFENNISSNIIQRS